MEVAALAVVFPAWLKYVYTEDIDRFVRFAQNVWGVSPGGDKEQTALAGISKYEEFLRGIGMPTRLSQLDVPEEGIPQLTELAFALGNTTIGNFKRLTPADVEAVYRLAL